MKQQRSSLNELLMAVVVTVLIFGALWYVSSILCLTDNQETFQRCESIRLPILGIGALVMFCYLAYRALYRNKTVSTAAMPSVRTGINKKQHLTGFLLCVVPPLVILVGMSLPGNGMYSNIFRLVIVDIAWVALIPCFIFGVILVERSKK